MGDAHAQVPAGSLSGVVTLEPLGTRMLLTAEQPLLLGAIERCSAAREPAAAARALTEIDWMLAGASSSCLLGQLSIIWEDLVGLELAVDGARQHMETAQLAPCREPTLALTFEARIAARSSTLALLVPYRRSRRSIERFGGREDAGPRSPTAAPRRRAPRRVGGVEVEVRAEVAAVELPIERVLALAPGDVCASGARRRRRDALRRRRPPAPRAARAAAAAPRGPGHSAPRAGGAR